MWSVIRRGVIVTATIGVLGAATAGVVSLASPDDSPVRVGTADTATDTATDVGPTAAASPTDEEIVVDRTTAEGVVIHSTLGGNTIATGNRMPADCVEPLRASTSVTNGDDTGTVSIELPLAGTGETAVVYSVPSGTVMTVVAYGPDLVSVTAHATDGRTETVDATRGFAVAALNSTLAGQVETILRFDSASFVFSDGRTTEATFDTLAGRTLVGADGAPRSSAAAEKMLAGQCSTIVPPTLPPAGDDQPGNAAVAADAEVRDTILIVGDGSLPIAERAALTTRPETATAAFNELPESLRAQGSGLHAVVDDVVFTDATTAIALVDVLVDGSSLFADSYVKLVEEDGTWLVTWESLCRFTSSYTPIACKDAPTDYPPEARRLPG